MLTRHIYSHNEYRSDAAEVQAWARQLGVARSELLREALRKHLVQLAGEHDADLWQRTPMTTDEQALTAVEDWGPAPLSAPRMLQACWVLQAATGC